MTRDEAVNSLLERVTRSLEMPPPGETPTSDEIVLKERINENIDLIEGFCERSFLTETYEEEAPFSGTTFFKVKRIPIIEIFEIKLNDYALNNDNYYLDLDTGIFHFVTPRTGDFYIRYSAGFDDYPLVIKQLVVFYTIDDFNFRNVQGISRGALGDLSFTKKPKLIEEDRLALRHLSI